VNDVPPAYIYPGQAFDEMGSLFAIMPNYPRLAFDLANSPGSSDVTNMVTRSVMQSNVDPYGE
jgi:hypothetical protein